MKKWLLTYGVLLSVVFSSGKWFLLPALYGTEDTIILKSAFVVHSSNTPSCPCDLFWEAGPELEEEEEDDEHKKTGPLLFIHGHCTAGLFIPIVQSHSSRIHASAFANGRKNYLRFCRLLI